MGELLSVADAQTLVLDAFSPTEAVLSELNRAAGRVLGETICSDQDLPHFDNSSMDGFAVRSKDVLLASLDTPVGLKVVADIPAGQAVPVILQEGESARIMTGAPIPDGADAVVPVEETDRYTLQSATPLPNRVEIYKPVRPGDYIRIAGQDVRRGDIVLEAGRRLRSQDVGLLAMLGRASVYLHRKPCVAYFSSGDELIPLGAPLSAGKVYDSNSFTLAALLEKYGAVGIPLGIAADQIGAVESTLEKAVGEKVDLIISSAGVSVGAFDYVRAALEKNGSIGFWRVDMRPGKPLTFGSYRDIPFIGLPGNPVSAFIGFEVFVRPVLNRLSGLPAEVREYRLCYLAQQIESDGRESFLRAIVEFDDGRWIARLTGHQGSGNLRSLVQANALLLIPSGVKSLPVGATVKAWTLDG